MLSRMPRSDWRRQAFRRYETDATKYETDGLSIEQILEKDNWDGVVKAGGKYYFTR